VLIAIVCYAKVQPSTVLAFLSRTPTSLIEHGRNVDAWWSPDSDRIVVKVRGLIHTPYDS
jgi:RAB6A-GEF complex partner protein 1